MCTRQQCIDRIQGSASFIQENFGVSSLCLFGSVARGENKVGSDVDICVEMPPKAFKVLALKTYLQELLGSAVDVIRRHTNMDEFLRKEIDRDGIYLIS